MPTFKNETATTIVVYTPEGDTLNIYPSETKELDFYPIGSALTMTLATPYYNDLVARTTVTLSGTPYTLVLNAKTKYVFLFHISATVTVYRQAVANTPPVVLDWTPNDPVKQIDVWQRCTQLVLTGTGTCVVEEYSA